MAQSVKETRNSNQNKEKSQQIILCETLLSFKLENKMKIHLNKIWESIVSAIIPQKMMEYFKMKLFKMKAFDRTHKKNIINNGKNLKWQKHKHI